MKKIVVVIAHFNNPKGLKDSLSSIQEDFNIDIIVVDDGSTTKFDEDLIREAYTTGTIYFDYLASNQGVGVAANRGLDLAVEKKYELIGRLDCGDFCHPNKYKKQLDYLLKNPDVKLLGTWAQVLDEKGNFLHNLKHPVTYSEIKKKMYLNSMFLNPSVVFYSSILEKTGKYPYKYRRAAQDYAFFFNVIKHYKAENLPEICMDYIVESHSISTKNRKLQVKNRISILKEHFYWGVYPLYGIIRSTFLYFIPRNLSTAIKKLFKI
ncbi:glycosyl transferase, family 2 [unidentified eubacterium SCB49]|nr:glycosyl transferase, family 2 [unidentified eubacterium SCB49]